MTIAVNTTTSSTVATQSTTENKDPSLCYSLMILLGETLETGQNAQLDSLEERANTLNKQLEDQVDALAAVDTDADPSVVAAQMQIANNNINQTQQKISTTMQVQLTTAEQQITLSQNLAGKQLGFLNNQIAAVNLVNK